MNRLADETSPYLRQHADNPVDWYPWGDEAFARARAEDRPILLSVGYSSCHWCHVMAHESFEDPATADLMNRLFVNVKVDREERPDVDAIYMQAVQAMTGGGGWPMTVFLTPDGRPFFGGTYFPKDDRQGMPGFTRVLEAVDDAWQNRRDELLEQSGQLEAMLQRSTDIGTALPVGHGPVARAARAGVRERPGAVRSPLRRVRPGAEVPAGDDARLPPALVGAGRRSRRARDGDAPRSTPWPRAASTTRSAAASIATPSTRTGSCPTSRRCSTTRRCCSRRTRTGSS